MNSIRTLLPLLVLLVLGPSCPSSEPPNYDYDNDGYSDDVDCDSMDPQTHPGATEMCGDEKDNDCDGFIDEADDDCPDADDDDDATPGDDDDATPGDDDDATPGDDDDATPGDDDDATPGDDDDTTPDPDGDGDGYTVGQGDCDDANADVNPGEPEICDEVDNDCDGTVNDWDGGIDTYETGDDSDAVYFGDLTGSGLGIVPFASWPGDVDRFEFDVTDAIDAGPEEFEIIAEVQDPFASIDLRIQIVSVDSVNGLNVTLVDANNYGPAGMETAIFEGAYGVEDSGRYMVVVEAVAGYDCSIGYWLNVTITG